VNVDTGERVAVKILARQSITSKDQEQKMKREVMIMKKISHPNIVNLLDVHITKHSIYLIMDLIRGEELYDKIAREGKQTEAQARRYFQQLVDAVEYMHLVGVCHRDLKPENILVDEDDKIHITDFGLSALIYQDGVTPLTPQKSSSNLTSSSNSLAVPVPHATSTTVTPSTSPTEHTTTTHDALPSKSSMLSAPNLTLRTSTAPTLALRSSQSSNNLNAPVRLFAGCGTPHYTAPEVLSRGSKGYLGAPVDVWSAGIILYVLSTGHFPFNGKTVDVLYQRIRAAAPKYPEHFSPELADLLKKILVADPEKRITIPEIKAHPWFVVKYTSVTNPPLPEFQEVDDAQWQEEEEIESEPAKLKRIRKRSSVSTHDGKLAPPTANAFALINMSGAFSLSKFVTTHHTPVSKNEELSTSVDIKDTPLKAGKFNTNFSSESDPDVIFKQLIEVLKRLPIVVRPHPNSFKINIYARTQKGPLNGTVQVYKLAPVLYMIDFRRLKGDEAEFYRLYRSVLSECSNLLTKRQSSNASIALNL
jgi:serine/threonine protein kinase